MSTSSKISVILVDDSSVIRGALSRIIAADNEIDILGSAENGQLAIVAANTHKPDVMILDVEMPVMDGLSALPQIMKASPKTKVIMCSSLTAKGADISIRAMALGAIECIAKPSSAVDTGPGSPFQITLTNLIKTLGRANKSPTGTEPPPPLPPRIPPAAQKPSPVAPAAATPKVTAQPIQPKPITQPVTNTPARAPAAAPAIKTVAQPAFEAPQTGTNFSIRKAITDYHGKPDILVIGSSTGGPQALFKVMKDIGPLSIPIVITQHMPATFTKILAEHITQQSGVPAHEGEDGMIVEPGKAYVAPGDYHMLFEKTLGGLKIKLDDGEPENFCKPAVDPMLRSIIDIYGKKALCVILTGMGHDGLQGCRALVEEGGRIIAQDEETSIVWGMPGAVAMDGICSAVLPVNNIGPWVKNEGMCR